MDDKFIPIEDTLAAADAWVVADKSKVTGWRPPCLMPAWATRYSVRVVSVRAEPEPWTWVVELEMSVYHQ